MGENLVLVDTSVWLEHLTQTKTPFHAYLTRKLEENEVAINQIIRLELLTGARDNIQYRELNELLKGLPLLIINEEVYEVAQRLRFEMRQKGYLLPVPDVLIGATAIVYRRPLVHLDKHFQRIAEHTILLKMESVT